MTKEEAKKILTEYVKACREDDMLTLEQFTYEEVIEAMDIGAEAISVLPVSSDLEKAAGEYAEKHGFRVPYDGSNNFYDDIDIKASKEGFIAGAEWKEEQLMKVAMKMVVEDWNPEPHPEITIPLNPEEFMADDKVKVIMIKED